MITMNNIQIMFLYLSMAVIFGLIVALALVRYFRKSRRQAQKQNLVPVQTQVQVSSPSVNDKTDEQSKGGKSKRKKKTKNQLKGDQTEMETNQLKTEIMYSEYYYGSLSLRAANSMHTVTAISVKNSKVLFANTKNELMLYDLKKWKKQAINQERYFTSLDNNNASAVAIGTKYYFVALTFDRTIAYYEFEGERGVYFKEIAKFPRNIFKSQASSLYVPENENYVVSTGSSADTVINVWSMTGERLFQVNTYQIEHYSIKYSLNSILVRGWTSEVKLFALVQDKIGNFCKVEKSRHLSHTDNPKCSAIDNFGLFAITVSKSNVIVLWKLQNSPKSLPAERVIDACSIYFDEITICAVHTVKDVNERYRTIIVLSDNQSVTICDQSLRVMQTFKNLQCNQIYLIGSMKNVVMGTVNSTGKMSIWNITGIVQKFQQYTLD